MTNPRSTVASRPRWSPPWSGASAYVPWGAAVASYVGACTLCLIAVLVSAEFGPVGAPRNLIDGSTVAWLTAANVVSLALLLHGLLTLPRGPGSFRFTKAVGAVLGIANVALLQVGVLLAYAPPVPAG